MLPLRSVIEQFSTASQATSGVHYLITPNRRLASLLRHTHDQLQQQQNKKTWPTLAALPWDEYLYSLWKELQTFYATNPAEKDFPYLISMQQEFVLWEQVIEHHEQAKPLLKTKAAVQLAMETYGLMRNWRLTEHDVSKNPNPDWLVFESWLHTLTKKLTEAQWFLQADLITQLMQHNVAALFSRPTYLWFYGFERFTPAQMAWLAHLNNQYGVSYQELTKISQRAQVKQQGFLDVETEYRACAVWIRQNIEEDPTMRLAVVVPQLERDRSLITKILREYLCPERLVNRQFDDLNQWINISGGTQLARVPMIHDALLLLSFSLGGCGQQQFSQLLRSPFLGGAEHEHIARANFDALCQTQKKSYWTLKNSLARLKKMLPEQAPQDFMVKLEKISIKGLSKKQTIQQWGDTFEAILVLWDWPGERVLSSEEHQIHKKWWECLTLFRSLQWVMETVSYDVALKQLQQITETLYFQAQTQEARVQILGLLEADAQEFDALWITGLHSQAWPQAIRPNPLLPLELQRQQAMPHASPERELDWAKKILQRFSESTQQLILSWPQQQEGQTLLISPLLRHYPSANRMPPYASFWRVDRPPLLDFWEETHGPEIPVEQALMGGSGLLKTQAECPFKAFVRYRLHAKPYETVSLGLTPQERGQLVHGVLEIFWRFCKTHENLMKFSDAVLEKKLQECIVETFSKFDFLSGFSSAFLQLEQQRLLKITLAWLALEKQREPFEVILLEQSRWVSIQSRTLSIRMDRVDRLASGKQLVIDYKTGETKKIDWLAERLLEPQLPLYASSDDAYTQGIMNGHLIAGKCVIKGFSVDSMNSKLGMTTCSAEDWEYHRVHWRGALAELVNEIISGSAVVQPYEGKKTCEYCDFTRVCRIGEQRA